MSQSLSISPSALEELLSNKAVRCIFKYFPEARVVGGAVRDVLLGQKPKDIDMAVALEPRKMMNLLKRHGVTAIPTGISHGTITVLRGKDKVELTSLRKDVKTDGRHAEVAWTDNWEEDAARRDFTINALSLDISGSVFDYFRGLDDLKNGCVRFVGNPARRIEEDGLRILRFFRFYGRFATASPNSEAVQAIQSGLHMLDRLSAERVATEVEGILSLRNRVKVASLMEDVGVWERIFSPADITSFEKISDKAGYLTCLAVLFNNPEIGKRLKLSNKACKFLNDLAKDTPSFSISMSDADIRRVLFSQSKEVFIARIQRAQAIGLPSDLVAWDELITRVQDTDVPKFDLLGADVKSLLGITEGPKIGEVLDQIRGWWLEDGAQANREACLERLQSYVR